MHELRPFMKFAAPRALRLCIPIILISGASCAFNINALKHIHGIGIECGEKTSVQEVKILYGTEVIPAFSGCIPGHMGSAYYGAMKIPRQMTITWMEGATQHQEVIGLEDKISSLKVELWTVRFTEHGVGLTRTDLVSTDNKRDWKHQKIKVFP